jgi:CheY-like chemotaxis protein
MKRGVLIVDDHASFRRLARKVLETGGFNVVGEAADGASTVRAVASLQPDVVLLDVVLPDTDGFTVAEALADEPWPPIVS